MGWDAVYDPLGRRIRKSPGYTHDTLYYWDGDRLAAGVFHDGKLRVYVYPDTFAMVPMLFLDYASVEEEPDSGARYFVLTDQRSCVERVLDDEGTVVWKAQVDAYGTARVEIGQTFYQPLRFPGHWYDSEIALQYNRFRYYDPTTGRYAQSDPWGLRGGLNLYAYTHCPLVYVDVRGLGCSDSAPPSDGEPRAQPDAEHEARAGTHQPSETEPSARAGKYDNLCEMLSQYRGEDTGDSDAFPGAEVRYLTPQQREAHRLAVGEDGRLYQGGEPFDTGDTGAMYVMDDQGGMYASTEQTRGEFSPLEPCRRTAGRSCWRDAGRGWTVAHDRRE